MEKLAETLGTGLSKSEIMAGELDGAATVPDPAWTPAPIRSSLPTPVRHPHPRT